MLQVLRESPSLRLTAPQEPCPHRRSLGSAREDPQHKKEHRPTDYSSKVLKRGRPTAGWPKVKPQSGLAKVVLL